MQIQIVPYQPQWSARFEALKEELQVLFGSAALRIDHIGSTSVPDLPAKDIIDVQVTVSSLEQPELWERIAAAPGFILRSHTRDELIGVPEHSEELKKRFLKTADLRHHIHVRVQGRLNQRYALLFRDFLRHNPQQRDIYALLKQRLAEWFPDNVDNYYHIKDPVMDLLYLHAESWARETGWRVESCA